MRLSQQGVRSSDEENLLPLCDVTGRQRESLRLAARFVFALVPLIPPKPPPASHENCLNIMTVQQRVEKYKCVFFFYAARLKMIYAFVFFNKSFPFERFSLFFSLDV